MADRPGGGAASTPSERDPAAPYGRKADGTPRAKPGPKKRPSMRGVATARDRKAKKREAQDRVLAMLAQGHGVEESCRIVGRTHQAYFQWRKTPTFKAKADSIRKGPSGEPVGDFAQFRKAYFGFDTFPHHRQIIEAIEKAQPRSVTMILVPPGAGKTTLLETWICYLLGPKDPNHRICVIGEKEREAQKRVRRVMNRMVDESMFSSYISAYGPFKPPDRAVQKPWSAMGISIVRAQNDERDFSLEARGAGGAIYGSRYTLIVWDDVQSDRNLTATDKLMEYFRQSVYTRLPPDPTRGRIIIIGTRVGPDDIYERMLAEGIVDDCVIIPALDEDGRSYWPETVLDNGNTVGFSEAELDRIRRVQGEEAWSRTYMMEPVSKRGQTFSDVVIEPALDRSRTIHDRVHPGLFTIGTLDPALSGHAAFRIASFDHERLYLVESRNEQGLGRYEEMWRIIDELSAKYRPTVWVIEGNNIQGGIARSDEIQDLSRRHGFRIETHQSGRNKMDQTIGVAAMAGSFIGGKISIPYGDQASMDNAAPLLKELKRWREDVPTKLLQQDEVMSLWFAHLYWQRMRAVIEPSGASDVGRSALPWAPMAYPVGGRV